jgi:hypothetical protein
MDWYSFVWERFLGQVEQNEKKPFKDLGMAGRKLLTGILRKWFSWNKVDSSGLEQGPGVDACEHGN